MITVMLKNILNVDIVLTIHLFKYCVNDMLGRVESIWLHFVFVRFYAGVVTESNILPFFSYFPWKSQEYHFCKSATIIILKK